MADSNIQELLTSILNTQLGKDMRQAIHDSIQQCYEDVSSPELNVDAFEKAVQNKIDSGELAAMTIADRSITVKKMDFLETFSMEPDTIFAQPFFANNYLNLGSYTWDNFNSKLNNFVDKYFFSVPWAFRSPAESDELYGFYRFLANGKTLNIRCSNYHGLEPGSYYYIAPFGCSKSGTLLTDVMFIRSTENNIVDAYNKYTKDSDSSLIGELIGTSYEDTPEYDEVYETNHYKMMIYQFTVPEDMYGYIAVRDVYRISSSAGEILHDVQKLSHISKVMLEKDYDKTFPLMFDPQDYYYFGNTEDGKRLMEGLAKKIQNQKGNADSKSSGYPINTYNKTYVVGGDSGTSYGATDIENAITERCGAIGSVRSVAGSLFSGTGNGGGLWFRNQYHDIGYPDIVVLCWGGNIDSGGMGSVTEDYIYDVEHTPTTTLGALRCIVEDIRTVSPDTCIIGWIPYQWNLDNTHDDRENIYNQIREGYHDLSIPVIDAWNEAGIVPRDMMDFDEGGLGSDQGHPSTYGKKRIARLIANTIIRYA